MTIIDAWIQHPTSTLLQQPFLGSLARWLGADVDLANLKVPHEMTIGALDAAGVDLAIASAWVGPQGPLVSNDDVAELIAAAPARIRGLASVDLSRPMEAVRELRFRVKEQGFVGLRILPWLWQLPPDDRRYYPLYAECVELGVPFCLQVGHTGPLMGSEVGRPIPYLERVALDFPELTIVGGHIGAPWVEEMTYLTMKCENVWIDTSAYKPKRYPRDFVEFMRRSECKRVLFGSNYPMVMPSDALDGIDDLGLSDAAKRRFLGENAAKVFGVES